MKIPRLLSNAHNTEASRIAALFFLVAGALAVAMSLLPLPGEGDPVALLRLGLADVAVAGAIWVLPWRRWHPLASLVLLVPAFGMIALFALAGLVSSYLYGTFYVLVFVWVGLSFGLWTSSVAAPLAALAYVLPLAGEPPEAAFSVLVVIPVCVLVGETIARLMQRARAARQDAEERAGALARSERRLAEAQRVGRVGSWEWDLGARRMRWSEELRLILGVAPTEDLGAEQLLDRVHPDDRETVATTMREAIADGDDFEFEVRIVRPAGTERLVEVRGEVVTERQGSPARLVGVMADVSERREIERVKAELVGVVSHELRTPLTAIYGFLELLREGELGALPPEAAELVELAAANADRLIRLLNDILDLERLESGPIDLEWETVDLGVLVGQVVAVMRPQAEEAGVDLVGESVPVRVWADPDRIFQVLVNLVSNAIKFSDPGDVVRVGVEGGDDYARVWVTDEGRGIPLEHQETIFGRFQQVDKADSREKGGTGLGLAICRMIVEQHGGRIGVESRPGEGTTFRFTFPVDQESQEIPDQDQRLLIPERNI